MGRKQTVYLSEELNRRLKPFRHVINLSAICSAAIEREVARLETAISDSNRLDTMSADELRAVIKTLLGGREGEQ